MKIEQRQWTAADGWSSDPGENGTRAQLVLAFGDRFVLESGMIEEVNDAYSDALVVGCSTAGEIAGVRVADGSLVTTAIEFDSTRVARFSATIEGRLASLETGSRLARGLDHDGLAHVFVLSDGLTVNGSELVRGLVEELPPHVSVTGGLSGDGARFERTLVVNDRKVSSDTVVVVGFYGEAIRVGYGSLGGWDPFGPERLITRSEGNVLYEFDSGSALGLYRRYLGDHASDLPSSGLLYPLSLRSTDGGEPIVRTILGIDEAEESLTFAGDVPEGAYARLMKANFDRLIDGAVGAAGTSHAALGAASPDLAILISCVGRKLILQQRIEEEVEGVRDALGAAATLAGFYSYGEISPFHPNAQCELHNQTMTITTLSEVAVEA